MGRAPKLIEHKKLAGTYREDRVKVKDPLRFDPVEMPRPPAVYADQMTDKELQVWAMVEPALSCANLFSTADIPALVKFCKVSVQVDEMLAFLAENGNTKKNKWHEPVERPEVRILMRYMDQFRAMCRDFGFNPLARDGIRGKAKDGGNDLDELEDE